MKPIVKMYLVSFLAFGLTYGLLMTGMDIADGHGFKLWKFLFLSISFGGMMSFFLVGYHKHELRKQGVQVMTDENLRPSSSQIVVSSLSVLEITELLKHDPFTSNMKMSVSENKIQLNSGVSWKSWGEQLNIVKTANSADGFEYRISSSPKLKTTLIDFGKNMANVEHIRKLIDTSERG